MKEIPEGIPVKIAGSNWGIVPIYPKIINLKNKKKLSKDNEKKNIEKNDFFVVSCWNLIVNKYQ